MAPLRSCKWICLRLNNALIKRHVLVLNEYLDLKYLGFEKYKYFEYVIFRFCDNPQLCRMIETNHNYCMQVFKCPDNMQNIRHNIKCIFKTSILGHICIIDNKTPMYLFLKEWFVLPEYKIDTLKAESLIWGFPHVIVFDLDSTLITEEERVQIRDPFVYESLQELQNIGCILILWSYGCKEHVASSLTELGLTKYFDIIIAEGSVAQSCDNAIVSPNMMLTDYKLQRQFIVTNFNLDISNDEQHDYLPKSPKIVIKHLSDKNLNYFKSITLVDDLPSNNYAYDFYIQVQRCPEPVHDWEHYHSLIIQNMQNYENTYNF
ncbi:38K [Lonomia obliqua multiple nucleopolyhedrovirus]|uniref:38K n=1 Tax=Lonomia obliqua multiple nucleopolyhedrovirus TaxID=134394 RepID=A0A126FC55_9ABAC|nr:38K [Lonomia obliqua multiple nucleopolyhedrovirus]AKN80969.1 38K [Lonomia obliqua multiple nucleopolyhedrovirus]